MEILVKNWTAITPFTKKYLARQLTWQLGHLLDHKHFEVVFEARINRNNPNEPDVVVYSKDNMTGVMAIEICRKNEFNEMILIASELMQKETSLMEFFIFESDENIWYSLQKSNDNIYLNSNSFFGDVNLKQLSDTSLFVGQAN